MSRPFKLQRRLRAIALVPAFLGAIPLTIVAALAFRSASPLAGAIAAVSVVAVIAVGVAAVLSSTKAVSDGLAQVNARIDAVMRGAAVRTDTQNPIADLQTVETKIDGLANQRQAVKAQVEAVSAGKFDQQVLDRPAPGPVGAALWNSLDGFRRASYALRDSHAVTTTLMDNVSDSVVVADATGRVIACNAAARAVLDLHEGSLEEAVPGWNELPSGDHRFNQPAPDGTLMMTHLTSTRVMTTNGALVMLCWRDMSGEQAVQAQVAHIARTDIVTALANRQGLLAAHDRLRELNQTAGVIHVDLVDFGDVNQRHGYLEGDRILQEVADRLRRISREEDTVARISGDEFVLLLESQPEAVGALARRVLEHVCAPIELDGGSTVSLEAYAGWSTGLADESYELLRRAHYALGQARTSPDRVSGYTAETAQRDEYRRLWREELRKALDEDEFQLFAQPIVDVVERQVLGVEIFVRWQHPSGRLISPSEFLPIADDSDMVVELDRWVIAECIKQAVDADPSIVFSLNVSTRFLSSGRMAEYVHRSLNEHGLPPGRIQIDVTETNVENDAASAINAITTLDAMGVRVALDDFGTGYSSLAHLLEMPISTVKIDRRIVGMVTEPEGEGVASAIIAFARKRELDIVAEGVESPEEVAALTELGCRNQQGYFHGHPAPLETVLGSLGSIPFQAIELPPASELTGDPVGAD